MKIFISLIVICNFAFSASFVYPNFKQCYKKNIKSIVYFGSIRAIAVSKHYAVAYLKKRPKQHFVREDPYLHLYLFYSQKPLHPIKLRSTDRLSLGEWLASMDDNSLYIGNFSRRGVGLDSYFMLNSKTSLNSMISSLCCDIYGLGIGGGQFISSDFIKKLLTSTSAFYGDIGVKFAKDGKNIIIAAINPHFPNQKLKVGDIIKKIDGKKIKTASEATNLILFQKKNHILKIEFLRKHVLHVEKIRVLDRFATNKLSAKANNSFLKNRGIFFDDKMKISRISKGSFGQKSGLKVGDKLLQIDKTVVKNQNEAKKIFSKIENKEVYLLFERNNFQFFVKVKI